MGCYYCVNKVGDHEVHRTTGPNKCSYLPDTENRLALGEYDGPKSAIEKARKTYPDADGCAHCCPGYSTK